MTADSLQRPADVETIRPKAPERCSGKPYLAGACPTTSNVKGHFGFMSM